ncbi:PRC-barrel domain-containing protein [Caldiplasma sukawensis]
MDETVEMSKMIGKDVYTQFGKYIGKIIEVLVVIEENGKLKEIKELIVSELREEIRAKPLINGAENIGIPYKWVKSVEDIVVLHDFPKL